MNTHISKTGLIQKRGWTDKLIERYLGQPDKLAVNMHYMSGPKVKLWELVRVEEVEKSAEFVSDKQLSDKRRIGSKKSVETKTKKILDYVANVQIEVEKQDLHELYAEACDAYNSFHDELYQEVKLNNCDREFLHRITVNYIRHNLSCYEQELEAIAGKVGIHDAYVLLKTKILDKIGETYPKLLHECKRQKCDLQEDIMLT